MLRAANVARVLVAVSLVLLIPYHHIVVSAGGDGGAIKKDVTVNSAAAHDVSKPLRSLVPADDESESAPQQNPSPTPTPPIITSPPGAGAIEQKLQGTRPAAKLVESFDGLGVGFKGPQGEAILRNPSDNTIAVGPDHIFQIVNTRIAIFA